MIPVPLARGYDLATVLPSKVQVNDIELSANFICWPTTKAWEPIVNSITPVVGSYVASVTLKLTIGDLPTWRSIVVFPTPTTETGCSNDLSTLCVIPPVTADVNVCASMFVDGVELSDKDWISKVSVVVLETCIHFPLIGSLERGYDFALLLPRESPTLIVNSVPDVTVTAVVTPAIGSVTRGYVWVVAW